MKLLMENFKKYLNEIGDLSVEPYPFKLHKQFRDGEVFFEFKSDAGSQYYVGFAEKIGPPGEVPWEISFDVDESTELTHENEPLKIMSTVVATIKEFIATPQYHKGNLKFVFEGIPKSGSIDSTWVPTKRTNLYMRYLKKNMPPATEIEQIGNVVKFEVPSENDEE
jgi:hypothetical protein